LNFGKRLERGAVQNVTVTFGNCMLDMEGVTWIELRENTSDNCLHQLPSHLQTAFIPHNVIYSVEIPTRCSFVIEFIIAKFIEGSTCFERHTAHHQEL
jgi:hypothetical protein